MYILITYDVSTDEKEGRKRLRQVAKLCVNHGQRVQNSVFECLLDQAEYIRLKNDICSVINLQKDSVRFYILGKNWKQNIEYIGKQTAFDIDDILIV